MDFLFDLYRTLRFATRLPLPALAREADDPIVDADAFAPAFTLTGALIGLLGGGTIALLAALGASHPLAALLGVAAMIALTGALHEDGLADCADGIGGGRTRERKLEIMRDPTIGTYGVLALVLSVGARIAALAALAALSFWLPLLALVATQTVSRAASMALAAQLDHARPDGAAARMGRPTDRAALFALGIGGGISLVALLLAGGWLAGFTTWIALLAAAALVTFRVVRSANLHLGGQTGDVLGAGQQLADLAGLVVLSICFPMLL